jgi:hypothetical protein
MASVANRFTVVEGPVKREVINLTAVNTGDTVVSNLVRPLFAQFVPTSATVAANDVGNAITVSDKTITITNVALIAATGVLTIWGF